MPSSAAAHLVMHAPVAPSTSASVRRASLDARLGITSAPDTPVTTTTLAMLSRK